MKQIVFILFTLVSTVLFSQEVAADSPKIAIKIKLGESIQLENHTIKFVTVLEDSRCPKYTTCVWEGRAKVLVEILENGKTTEKKELIFGKVMQGESNNLVLFSEGNKKIMGLNLNPYPTSEEDTKNDPYTLLVYSEKI